MKAKPKRQKDETFKRILRVRTPKIIMPVIQQPGNQRTVPKVKKPRYLILRDRRLREYRRRWREPRANEAPGKYLKVKYYCDRCIEEVCRMIFATTKQAKDQQSGEMTSAELETDAKKSRLGRTPRHRKHLTTPIPFSNYDAHVVPYELSKIRVINKRTSKKRSEMKPPKIKMRQVTKPTTTINSRGFKYRAKMLEKGPELTQHLQNIGPEKDLIVILAQTNYDDKETKARYPNPHDLHTDLIVVFKPRKIIYYLAPAPLKRVRRDDEYRKKNKALIQRTIIQLLSKHIPGVQGFGVESEIQIISDRGGNCLFMGLRGCAYLAENGMPDPRTLRKEVHLREDKRLDRETVTACPRYYERLFEEAYQTCPDKTNHCNSYVE